MTEEELLQNNMEALLAFRLMDDDFLTVCFDGFPEGAELLLRIVLSMPDLKVETVRTQEHIGNLLGRAVRLDVLATDAKGRKFDIEIQRDDRGAGVRRARFYSSMLDTKLLAKGEDFDAIPETYVIFITEDDFVGKNQPLYPVERYFEGGEKFDDGSHILYVNGAYRDEHSDLGKLIRDLSCTEPDDMTYKVLAERVRYFKYKEGRYKMCRIMEDIRNEGYQRGSNRKAVEVATRMIKQKKYTLEEICLISGLPISEVEALLNKVSA